MNLSGILVVARPGELDQVEKRIAQFPWAEVHYSQPDGSIVVTVEGENTQQDVDRLIEIKKLPGVILAEMVNHYPDVEEEDR